MQCFVQNKISENMSINSNEESAPTTASVSCGIRIGWRRKHHVFMLSRGSYHQNVRGSSGVSSAWQQRQRSALRRAIWRIAKSAAKISKRRHRQQRNRGYSAASRRHVASSAYVLSLLVIGVAIICNRIAWQPIGETQ